MLKLIGLDMDDTLIATAKFFVQARRELIELLIAHGMPPQNEAAARADIDRFEHDNIMQNGFSMATQYKCFIEVALKNVPSFNAAVANGIGGVIERLQNTPRPIFDDTRAFLEEAATLGVPIVLITVGEYNHQAAKLNALKELMGPSWCAAREFIVQRKDEVEYSTILNNYGINPDEFVMVGDSMKSDIVPVRKLGGQAVLIERPSENGIKWDFNKAAFDGTFDRAQSLHEALALIRTRIVAEKPLPAAPGTVPKPSPNL